MKSVCIIVPLYKGKEYISKIIEEVRNQNDDNIKIHLHFVLTETNDGSKELLKSLGASFECVEKDKFSHSLTREKAICHCNCDIAILMTQDCRLVRSDAVVTLANCINDEVKFAYLKQVNSNNTIEKYTRQLNYPDQSLIKDQKTISTMGINAYFASDAFSAYDVRFFMENNGYDHKDLPTSEDMYYAWKVINLGKKVMYCADSYVDHTHKFTLKQLKQRYFLVGQFLKMNPQISADSHATKSGFALAKSVLKLAIKDRNLSALIMFLPNMMARFIGKKQGEKNG